MIFYETSEYWRPMKTIQTERIRNSPNIKVKFPSLVLGSPNNFHGEMHGERDSV